MFNAPLSSAVDHAACGSPDRGFSLTPSPATIPSALQAGLSSTDTRSRSLHRFSVPLLPRPLRVPDNISLLPLPSYSPQLNPIENVWAFLRTNHLNKSVWDSYDEIVDACCRAWNAFIADVDRVASVKHQPAHQWWRLLAAPPVTVREPCR